MNEDRNMAIFCDFENIALGMRDAHYNKCGINPLLGRLLLKGSFVTKKAYCDWDRYKKFKPGDRTPGGVSPEVFEQASF